MNSTLEQIKQLFSDRQRFTKRAYARDYGGVEVHPNDPMACSWCILGGISRICDGSPTVPSFKVAILNSIKELATKGKLPQKRYLDIPAFNDDPKTTVEHVQLVIENAKKHLKLS